MHESEVLHVGAGLIFGGVESFLASIGRHSVRTKPDFVLSARGRLETELGLMGRTVRVLPPARISRPLQVWRARKVFGRILEKGQYPLAVFHSAWMQILFGPVLRRYRIPLVVWIHGVNGDKLWLEKLAQRQRPIHVLTASRHLSETVRAWYPDVPRSVIGIPVVAPVRLSVEGRALIRRELGALPEDAVVIISCRLDSWKGHEFLFRALAEVRSGNQWKQWVVGGGQEPGDANRRCLLELLVHELGLADRIRFLGHRDDVWKLLQAADIHCQPNSGPEPFGIAFVEALYAEIPVISTSIGGALEIVTSDCGILVPPRDSVALASALTCLIENLELRRSLGSAGPSRARLLCDPDRQVADIERVLLSCLGL